MFLDQGRVQVFFLGGGVACNKKNFEKCNKDLFICIFVAFLLVRHFFFGGGRSIPVPLNTTLPLVILNYFVFLNRIP